MLGAKVYQVLKTGAALEPFRYEPENAPGTIYNVSVVPFQRGKVALPSSVLLTADDLTQSEQLRKLEVEAANLRLVRTMADRLAHEIGNAMVPLSTHQQLLTEKFRDPEFRESLDHALAGGVKRVSRLLNQMRFLAREGQLQTEVFGVEKLIEDAYQDATQQQPVEGAQLKFESNGQAAGGFRRPRRPETCPGGNPAKRPASQSEKPSNRSQGCMAPGGSSKEVTIEVLDNGGGFSAEAARKIPSPFYTTRNVGLGLGLAVSQKIIETHHGKLEIIPSPSGLVRVSLPAESALAANGSFQ